MSSVAAGQDCLNCGAARRGERMADGLGAAWLAAYYFLALHRVYGESWARTLVKGTAIGVLYVAVIALSMLALFNIIFAVVK